MYSVFSKISFTVNRGIDDFGEGFYTTPEFHYSMWWALLPLNRNVGTNPAVMVFSIDADYNKELRVANVEGKHWIETIAFLRIHLGKPPDSTWTTEVIKGAICRNTKAATVCRETPKPANVPQLCFRLYGSDRLLKLEKIIIFKQGQTIPKGWPHSFRSE